MPAPYLLTCPLRSRRQRGDYEKNATICGRRRKTCARGCAMLGLVANPIIVSRESRSSLYCIGLACASPGLLLCKQRAQAHEKLCFAEGFLQDGRGLHRQQRWRLG